MPELTDQQLDADIARSLRFSTLVTPLQQYNAKERLLRKAAEQTVLEPLAAERFTLRDHAHSFRERTRRLVNFLILDSVAYERVSRPLSYYRYYGGYGRYAFTLIRISA